LGGLHLIADMRTKYSLKDLYNMLETLDAYDAMKKLAHDKATTDNKK
jgi:hypothetical protein